MNSNFFINSFNELLDQTKALGEDGVAATTTAAIPVKVVVSPKAAEEYKKKNALEESTTDISKLVPNITPGETPIVKKKPFMEMLVDVLENRNG